MADTNKKEIIAFTSLQVRWLTPSYYTRQQDEPVTIIEGTCYLDEGTKFNSTKLKGYPAGSLIVIPAGVPHFVATKDRTVIV
ncbi:MAG: hypothetical protein DMG80_03025 [Acidobacteria bacterium]|nr:MAG: hypothetical protein DMG80_03025 [Acidobacteriota bacterium]